ncbi:hypothetical protein SETIT_4G271900v2 [Setaria italica]|uniref:Uncharacterized protein n=1 Tax=Setaria italica TaxID=4555 RepID=A0A368QZ43_SETIT|nr:hypothetical protein SETIT_4G271900v2 [Setaria italica]
MSVSKPSLKTQECSISQLIKLEEADKDVALMVADRVTLSGTTPSTIIQYNTSNAESKTLQRIDDVMVELQHSSARLGISLKIAKEESKEQHFPYMSMREVCTCALLQLNPSLRATPCI